MFHELSTQTLATLRSEMAVLRQALAVLQDGAAVAAAQR